MSKPKRHMSSARAQNLANALASLGNGTYKNLNQAAKATGTSVHTIYHRLCGGKLQHDANTNFQALTPMGKAVLVTYIQHSAAVGHPVRHDFLCVLAEEIRKQCIQAEEKPIKSFRK
jgi:hypothetical protein